MAHKPVQSLHRADHMIRAVATAPGGCSLKELATAGGCSSPAAMHMAQTLVAIGFLERRDDGRYLLGPAPAELARGWRGQRLEPAIEAAIPLVHAVAPAPGCGVSFCQLRGTEVVITSSAPRHRPGRVVHGGTQVLRPYSSMAGMVHLAFIDDQQARRYRAANPFEEDGLARWGSVAACDQALAEIRERGAFAHRALDDERRLRLGVPVFEPDGGLIGSLTIDVDEVPPSDRRAEVRIIETGRATARAITAKLGRNEP